MQVCFRTKKREIGLSGVQSHAYSPHDADQGALVRKDHIGMERVVGDGIQEPEV